MYEYVFNVDFVTKEHGQGVSLRLCLVQNTFVNNLFFHDEDVTKYAKKKMIKDHNNIIEIQCVSLLLVELVEQEWCCGP